MELVTRAVRMLHDEDPKGKLIRRFEEELKRWTVLEDDTLVGIERMQPLAARIGIRVFGPDILLMIYEKSGQYTSGKVFVPEAYIEDKVQGKIGLICGIGPLCEGPDYERWFGGKTPKLGDWMMTSIRDGYTFVVGGIVMKQVEWKYLRLATLYPDVIV